MNGIQLSGDQAANLLIALSHARDALAVTPVSNSDILPEVQRELSALADVMKRANDRPVTPALPVENWLRLVR